MNTFDEYQQQTHKTAIYPEDSTEAVCYLTMGLCSEAGEIASLVKKQLRDGTFLDQKQLEQEIGDVLWYLSELCNHYWFELSDVAAANLAKLADRQARGVLGGSGDKR